MMKNRAAFLLKNRKIEVRDTEMPGCPAGYVKLKVEYCGVCGSDVHIYSIGEPAFPDIYPFILGHEFAGTVVEIGEGVTDLVIGDRVAVEPGITCGKCEWCRKGKYNLCKNIKFLSAPREHGAMRNYISHPADLCFKLPDHVSSMEGALVEPLAVGVHAVQKSGIQMGNTAAVLGTGCIGLNTIMALKAEGINNIIVCDLFDIRLEKALEVGAEHGINSKKKDLIEEVLKLTGGIGVDFVFETAGNAATAEQAIHMVKRGGTIMQVGNIQGQTTLGLQPLIDKEITVQTSFRYRNVYPVAIDAIASGRIDVKGIVSSVYSLDDTMQAFEDCINNKQTMVKAVIKLDEESETTLNPEIICIGMGTVDLLAEGIDDIKLDGQTRFIKGIQLRTGGDATNEAITLKKLGHEVMLITTVGSDYTGEFYKRSCEVAGVDSSGIITDSKYPTATAVVLIGRDGERSFLAVENNAAATMRLKRPDHIEMKSGIKVLSIASLFYTAEQKDEDMSELLIEAKAVGAVTIADLVMDRKEMGLDDIRETLRQLDYIVPSLNEGRYYTGKDTPEEIASVLHEYGVPNVIVKLGAEGIFASTVKKCYRVSTIADKVIDTTGAGDNFMAGFISGLVRGLEMEEALYFGSATSAIAIGELGATGAVNSLEQVQEYLQLHRNKR
ncbi:MAG: PfkB family carbohydrate kinase [Suipraeoptans sp.]